MSGIDVIVTALAAGATAGLSNNASALVQDAYATLKAALLHRFGGREQDREALLADATERSDWETLIGEHLATSGAADDAEVLAAARRLLELTAAPGPAGVTFVAGDHATQYNAVGGPMIIHHGVERRPGS